MALTAVVITWDERDTGQAGASGVVTFQPSQALTDTAGGISIAPLPKPFPFRGGTGQSAPLTPTDDPALQPPGWWYIVTVAIDGLQAQSFAAFIRLADGATQNLASLVPVVPSPPMAAYLPLPSGVPAAGDVPAATGAGTATDWAPPGGIPGVTVSGTPATGDLLTATGPSAADWQPVGFRQDFAAASVVTVTHNLGRYPAVTVTDTAGDIVHGDIVYLSLAAVRLTFSAPFGGTAICT